MIRAIGSTLRMRASAWPMVAAMSSPSASADTQDLRGDQEVIRSQVHGAQMNHPLDTGGRGQRGVNLVDLFGQRGFPDEQAGGLLGQQHRDRGEQPPFGQRVCSDRITVAPQDWLR
jgi:hypothetical protein